MNSDNKQQNKNLSNKSRLKKKIIIVMISILVLMALMFISIFVLDIILDKIQEKEEGNDFNFYEADYDENIFEDSVYLSLIENGYISYCDLDNVTLGIAEKDAEISRQREVIAKAEEALHRCKEELAALKARLG